MQHSCKTKTKPSNTLWIRSFNKSSEEKLRWHINNGLEDRKQQFGTNQSFSEGGEFTSTGTLKINAGTNVVQ